jgi:hypothetical protein
MPLVDLCLTASSGSGGAAGMRLGEPLLDAYLEFVAARCRPNTVLATAFDLKVFFSVVAKGPAEVTPADVFGFVTAQRAGAGTATAVVLVAPSPCAWPASCATSRSDEPTPEPPSSSWFTTSRSASSTPPPASSSAS